jgi:hypothetical protein
VLTLEPSNNASFYSCGFCPECTQVLVPAADGDGNPIYDPDTGQPMLVNDEPAAMTELGEHMDAEHPEAGSGAA